MEINEARLNTHMTHAEDLVLLGDEGIEELNNYIEQAMNNGEVRFSQKIDGAPAVICWNKFPGHPDNSICLKSFVNGSANDMSAVDEVEERYGDRPRMVRMLSYCLEIAKHIPAGQAWQGDCLFTKDTLQERTIGGVDYVTFQPNKIIYSFKEGDKDYNKIVSSDFGIAFHTVYHSTEDGLTQSFDPDTSKINIPGIYIMSPVIDKPNFELKELYSKLKSLESKLLANPDYETLVENPMFMKYWNTFENVNISDKQRTTLDLATFFEDLRQYVNDKMKTEFDKKYATLKTDKGRAKATENYEAALVEIKDILDNNKELIHTLAETLNCAADIKMAMLGSVTATPSYSTYLQKKTGEYEPSSGEGIAMSDARGNVTKLVDRSKFSAANRSNEYTSGFDHNESLEEDAPWVKNTINTVSNTDKDPAVKATKAWSKMKVKSLKKGQMITEDTSDNTTINVEVNLPEIVSEAPPSRDINATYDEQVIEDWWAFVEDVEDLVNDNFNVMSMSTSNVMNSLSEYIDFYKNDHIDESKCVIDMRVSNHKQTKSAKKHRKNKVSSLGDNYEMLTVTVNDKTYNSYEEAFEDIKQKLEAIKGDKLEVFNECMIVENKKLHLEEATGKTAVLIWGRMNPITKAHMAMIEFAEEQEGDTFIYLSHSQDKEKNPLPYDRKIYWAQKAAGNVVKESDARVIIQALQELQGYDNLIYICGSDRYEDMKELLNKYNGKPDKKGNIPYSFNSIEIRQFGNERIEEDLSLEQCSASLARKCAKEDDFETFKQVVPFDEEDARELFEEVKEGMKLNESLSINEAETNKLYDRKLSKKVDSIAAAYNLIKDGIDDLNIDDKVKDEVSDVIDKVKILTNSIDMSDINSNDIENIKLFMHKTNLDTVTNLMQFLSLFSDVSELKHLISSRTLTLSDGANIRADAKKAGLSEVTIDNLIRFTPLKHNVATGAGEVLVAVIYKGGALAAGRGDVVVNNSKYEIKLDDGNISPFNNNLYKDLYSYIKPILVATGAQGKGAVGNGVRSNFKKEIIPADRINAINNIIINAKKYIPEFDITFDDKTTQQDVFDTLFSFALNAYIGSDDKNILLIKGGTKDGFSFDKSVIFNSSSSAEKLSSRGVTIKFADGYNNGSVFKIKLSRR